MTLPDAKTSDDRRGGLLVYGAGNNQIPVIVAARRAGFRVVAVDGNSAAPGAALADVFVARNLRDPVAIDQALAREPLAGVVARLTDKLALESASQLARQRGLPAACTRLVEAATSKSALARACARANLATPRRFEADSKISLDEGPVIIRPDVTLRGKAGIRRVRTADALQRCLAEAGSCSGNRSVDIARWIEGHDVTALVQIYDGRARRLALWDEWVGIDDADRIQPFGCAIPSRFARDAVLVDGLLACIAAAFPESWCIIAVSIRIDSSGKPWIIEIHLGVGGDAIADLLLPAALPGFDVLDLWIKSQTGECVMPPLMEARPRALVREQNVWAVIEADGEDRLRMACRAHLDKSWEPPLDLRRVALESSRPSCAEARFAGAGLRHAGAR